MQVLLDKNPTIKTVVNKLDSIQNEFRVFPMEVIAGPTSMETEVVQHGSRCGGLPGLWDDAERNVQMVDAKGVIWQSRWGQGRRWWEQAMEASVAGFCGKETRLKGWERCRLELALAAPACCAPHSTCLLVSLAVSPVAQPDQAVSHVLCVRCCLRLQVPPGLQ